MQVAKVGTATRVPFVAYGLHYRMMWSEVGNAIADALWSGNLICRGDLTKFETEIAAFVGTKHAVGVGSGTDALLLSLKALDIKEGDEVITVSHTFVASLAAIIHCGACPVLVDVGDDMNMDVRQLEKAVSRRTRALMPVHLNGRLCNMDEVMRVAEDHGLAVVEDAAQALGAKYKGRNAGTFGVGCFSLYPAKILGCAGDGGFVTTDDGVVATDIRFLRDHCWERKSGTIFGWGYNSRLDNVQAAILNVKLPYLPRWIERRREIASTYTERLSDVVDVKLPPAPNNGDHYDVYQNYEVQVKQRHTFMKFMADRGVETLCWGKPNHLQDGLNFVGYSLPVTERLSKESVRLPIYPELTDEQVMYVADCVRSFYGD